MDLTLQFHLCKKQATRMNPLDYQANTSSYRLCMLCIDSETLAEGAQLAILEVESGPADWHLS